MLVQNNHFFCDAYCGLCCVNGYCPNAEHGCAPDIPCSECFYNMGCSDCMFAGDETCPFFVGPIMIKEF